MDDRAAISPAIVFGLVLIAFAAAFYIPVVVDDVDGTRELMVNQSVGVETNVYHEINSTIDEVSSGQDNVTVTIEDTNTRNSTTVTIDEAVEESVSLEGETILVNATIIASDHAAMDYVYPVDYGWPKPMKSIADNLGMIIMGLIAFLLLGWVWTY